jgi:hypothetical protein
MFFEPTTFQVKRRLKTPTLAAGMNAVVRG